jgi:hypothetical protein
MKTLFATISLLALTASPLVWAQDAGGARAACAADFQQYCAGVGPGPGRRQCLEDNKDKLSEGCKAAIGAMQAKAAGLREACAADAQKYCADAAPGQDRMKCMMANNDKLSDGCKSAIAGMGAGR